MAVTIGRRELLAALGGAAVAWPYAVRAQQPTMPVIGVFHSASPEISADRLRVFRQGLKEAGYVEGENVAIEYRWAENQLGRLPELAIDLVRRRVAVIAALGSNLSALAAKEAATTIPVVFIVSEDPVRLGLVTSLARLGGNLTGINFLNAELAAKRLERMSLCPRRFVWRCSSTRRLLRRQKSRFETWSRPLKALACKSKSFAPAPAARSTRLSQHLGASVRTPSSSPRTDYSAADASIWCIWQPATQFLRHTAVATSPKPAG